MTKPNKNALNYFKKYTKENYKAYRFLLDNKKDKNLIQYLDSIKRKTELIKSLLYQYMENNPNIEPNPNQEPNQEEDGRD